jgi:hypothetical protein
MRWIDNFLPNLTIADMISIRGYFLAFDLGIFLENFFIDTLNYPF